MDPKTTLMPKKFDLIDSNNFAEQGLGAGVEALLDVLEVVRRKLAGRLELESKWLIFSFNVLVKIFHPGYPMIVLGIDLTSTILYCIQNTHIMNKNLLI